MCHGNNKYLIASKIPFPSLYPHIPLSFPSPRPCLLLDLRKRIIQPRRRPTMCISRIHKPKTAKARESMSQMPDLFPVFLYTIPLPLLFPFIASHFIISCLSSENPTTDYFLCLLSGVNHKVCLLPRFPRSSLTFFA